MFARSLYMYLKNDGALSFKQKIEGEVVPLLRQQKGFLEHIAFLYLNGREVETFSRGQVPNTRKRITAQHIRNLRSWLPLLKEALAFGPLQS